MEGEKEMEMQREHEEKKQRRKGGQGKHEISRTKGGHCSMHLEGLGDILRKVDSRSESLFSPR